MRETPVTYLCFSELGRLWFRQWLLACSTQSIIRTIFSEIKIEIEIKHFNNIHSKMSSKCPTFCSGLRKLTHISRPESVNEDALVSMSNTWYIMEAISLFTRPSLVRWPHLYVMSRAYITRGSSESIDVARDLAHKRNPAVHWTSE